MNWPPIVSRPLMLLTVLAIGGCASQTEMARLQLEVVDLQNQLAYEKQRLKQAQQQQAAGQLR